MPLVVDLEQPITAPVWNTYNVWAQLALPTSNRNGPVFEVVGPYVSNDLDDLRRFVCNCFSLLQRHTNLVFRLDQCRSLGAIELEKRTKCDALGLCD